MERIKRLNLYQKGVLLLMMAMVLVFAVFYSVTISRVGFEYEDTILVPVKENGSTVYSGNIQGQQARFTVSEDKTVVFQYGNKTYGPYTAKEDPAAIPKNHENAKYMTGIELRQGEDIIFRGGMWKRGDFYFLYRDDGASDVRVVYMTGDGIMRDQNGTIVDPIEPSASAILKLMNEPKLTHKGEWFVWFGVVFLCILNAISILFADELFCWKLNFRIRGAEQAKPSDWEIVGRYIGWTALAIMALVLFIMGLR